MKDMANAKELADRISRELSRWPKGRLPTVRDLVSRYGSSSRTVQAAFDLLRTEGLVESRPRSGLWRAGEIPRADRRSFRLNVEGLSARMETEIRSGVHSWESPLPLIKELAARWNCHAQTATKVLERLLDAGIVERRGRFHFPIPPRTRLRSAAPAILCLGAGSRDGRFRIDTDRESDFWRELGAQASLAGLTQVRRVWNGGPVRPDAGIMGVIATKWHFEDPKVIYRQLARLKIPSCVWFDEQTLDAVSKGARIHFHDQGHSTENGILLARYLFDLGHRHIAFISPWHANPWSIKRYRGIEEEARRRGCRSDAFCLQGDSEWDRLIPAERDPVLARTFPDAIVRKCIEGSSDPVREFMAAQLGWNRIRRDMATLCDQALAGGATAWIGANDVCALNAMKWLEERGVPVPKRISVAGFDDSVEALRSDLTSFRFSCASMARAMIYQIISPAPTATLTRHRGIVVARGTTARAVLPP